jgi:hypothetical protein
VNVGVRSFGRGRRALPARRTPAAADELPADIDVADEADDPAAPRSGASADT